jgi:hypothetical protein
LHVHGSPVEEVDFSHRLLAYVYTILPFHFQHQIQYQLRE